MSHNMLEHPSGLYVTRFVGPARTGNSSRVMHQITVPSGQYVQLDREQWIALVGLCAAIAKLDRIEPSDMADL